MGALSEIWPFASGQQRLIFDVVGAAVIGLIILNLISATRQGFPIQKVLVGLFFHVDTKNKIEKNIRVFLLTIAVGAFFVLVVDVHVNGIQLMDLQELRKLNLSE